MKTEKQTLRVSRAQAEECLAGGGEMGALMRSFDWSATRLGRPADWPQSLRTSVSICLNSRFAILVWWGEELTMLYNDAYTRFLGTKSVWALGRPGKEVWREIWDVVGPMLQSVMTTGEATWSDDLLLLLERYGYPEECYFTFSYSPIRDESGGIAGIFTPVADTTEKVIGERRLRTLRDLATLSAEAKQVDEACRSAAEALANNLYDIPFSLLYLLDDAGTQARLVGAAGIEAGTNASPKLIRVGEDDPDSRAWPLFPTAQTGTAELIESLEERFGPLPGGAWSIPPEQALILPVTLPGRPLPTGILVAAVSPHKALDSEYRAFFDLVAKQIGAAVAESLAYAEERKRAESLAETDRAKTAFFNNVSHEFRTPLTLILGPIEEALSQPQMALAGNDLDAVYRNSLRLLRLVNTLLDFSRLESGRIQVAYQPTDLSALTTDLASIFRSAIEAAGLRLIVHCMPLPELVYVDREMWEKIVFNLLSNAFKFTLEGEIEVTLQPNAGAVEFCVRDTGTGIPADDLPSVFERFHRVAGSQGRTHQGTGIGLALVQELVLLHGGSVRVESTWGQGSAFTATLPLGSAHLPGSQVSSGADALPNVQRFNSYAAEAARWLSDESPTVTMPEAKAPRRGRVLFVDDNADMREYGARILSKHYEVETVADGQQALASIRERKPDLVISDIMMPRLDGFELLAALRADAQTQALPVILLSARAGEEASIEGLEAGADDYLVKPFSARELRARVETHLELARAREEVRAALSAAYEHERHIAAMLQRSLLQMPPENAFEGLSLATAYEAALNDAEVGGDFLDAFQIDETQMALVVGDVAGKGLSAATRTAEIKFTLRAFLREYASPAIALTRLNRVLCDAQILDSELHEGFVCLSLAVLDRRTGQVRFAVAGAESPLIVRASGTTEEIDTHGTPLTVAARAEYDAVPAVLYPGDLLVMVTDGITESRRGSEFFGYEGMQRVTAQEHASESLSEITQAILRAAKDFAGGTLHDDACLLLARRL